MISHNNLIIRFFHQINLRLTNLKLLKFCVISAPSIFIFGLFIGVVIAFFFGPESYNIWDNYISDLGSINYTPAPYFLDFSAMITAILLIPVFTHFVKLLFQKSEVKKDGLWKIFHFIMRILIVIGYIFLLLSIIGLFGIGLFSEDRTTELGLHLIFSFVVFGAFSFSAYFIGTVIILKKTSFFRVIGLFMICTTPTFAILFIINPENLTRPFIEWMMFLSICVWLLLIDLIVYNKLKKK
ncbi:MAG: DUF998 domain-containing protein [Candidatus Lokiarchaeota archaeon]|nr:DUF998 domain-containing protein [Candidatus Lokiarchaeota archaeon]